MAEIENGVFEFAERFPNSNRRGLFARLEGRNLRIKPSEVLFGEYAKRWWEEMSPGMSRSQVRDYTTILNAHLFPYFGEMLFSEVCSRVGMKRYVAYLKSRKNKQGDELSAKRIQNIVIPLRIIVRDAMDEYDWRDVSDPFKGLKLPKVRRFRVRPFSFQEWKILMECMLPWYRPYF
jgi:integrase